MIYFTRILSYIFFSLTIIFFFFFTIDYSKEYISNPDIYNLINNFSTSFKEIINELFRIDDALNKDIAILFKVSTIVLIFIMTFILIILDILNIKKYKENIKLIESYKLDIEISKDDIEEKNNTIKGLSNSNKVYKQKQKILDKYQNFYFMIHNNYAGNFLDFYNEYATNVLGKKIGDIEIPNENLSNNLQLDDEISELKDAIYELELNNIETPDFGDINKLSIPDELNDLDNLDLDMHQKNIIEKAKLINPNLMARSKNENILETAEKIIKDEQIKKSHVDDNITDTFEIKATLK
mgnify:CR=1 FL=1|jgi:hypothetical protein